MGRGRKRRSRNDDDDDNGFGAWGGYMAAKKSKLLEQYSETANSEVKKLSNIFEGVSIFVNGYTRPSAEELKSLMALHGGIYHHYHMPAKTSFIIASNLPDTKIKQLGGKDKIVKPEWISDSIKANKLLDYSYYLLYTNQNRLQPKLNFPKITPTKNDLDLKESNQHSPNIFDAYEENVTENKTEPKTKLNGELENFINLPRTLSAKDPRFLSEFYNNSRLHHISTLGAMFKQHICNLREQSDGKFPAREILKKSIIQEKRTESGDDFENASFDSSIIMHIDMDCFFVSVGLRSHPELRGHPVAVTHSKGGQEPSTRAGVNRQAEIECYKQRRQEKLGEKSNNLGPGNMLTRLEIVENSSMSEIASCSYEARKAGVKNGMFMGQALKLCPNLKTIPYDFEGYKEVAHTLYNTIAEYTLKIEAVSCDEMFVDISDVLTETGCSVKQWATYIRNLISERAKCPCSTGFGANRLLARMATKKAKPNGQFHLLSINVKDYMMTINVKDLPGIGRSISLKLNSINVQTCGDLQSYSLPQLQSIFGSKFGENLFNHCRGIDDKPLVYEHERKSISAEVNYGIRFKDKTETENFFIQLCQEVHSRLVDVKMKGKCITLKLMVRSKDAPLESSKFMGHGVCDYLTKSSTLTTATNDLQIIKKEIFQIINKLNVPPSELRGIGIQISRLEKVNKNSTSLTKFFKMANESNSVNPIPFVEKNEVSSSNMVGDAKKSPVTEVSKNVRVKISTSSNQNVSKTGKRGRPKGSMSNRNSKKIINMNNGNNLQNFLNSKNVTESRNTTPTIEVDFEVLNALPEDIQKEILQQYNIRPANKSSPKKIEPSNTIESKEISNLKNNDNKETENTNDNVRDDALQKSEQPMFLGMNLSEVRQLLREWVASENIPEACDIVMLAEYFRNLALDSKISDLFVMLKFLYNEISKQNKCAWHRAYFNIVSITQEGMMEKYGNSIYVYKNFNCPNNCS